MLLQPDGGFTRSLVISQSGLDRVCIHIGFMHTPPEQTGCSVPAQWGSARVAWMGVLGQWPITFSQCRLDGACKCIGAWYHGTCSPEQVCFRPEVWKSGALKLKCYGGKCFWTLVIKYIYCSLLSCSPPVYLGIKMQGF